MCFQLVSRHMYLLTEIWSQKLLIEDTLHEEEDDEVAAISKGERLEEVRSVDVL